jgi:hypothetical protein
MIWFFSFKTESSSPLREGGQEFRINDAAKHMPRASGNGGPFAFPISFRHPILTFLCNIGRDYDNHGGNKPKK